MKHLRKFDSVSEMNTVIANSTIGILGLAYNNGQPVMKKKEGSSPVPPTPSTSTPFYVENITNETETLTISAYGSVEELMFPVEYSTDGTNWSTLGITGADDLTMTLQPNDKVYLRATTNTWYDFAWDTRYSITGVSKVGGNIMSLLYGSNFTGNETTFPSESNYNFYSLFHNWYTIRNTDLINASELILPATTLTNHCYDGMFGACIALTTAPELPATTLADYCYYNMFQLCSSLTTAPELPATTLTNHCYDMMFYNCSNLNYIKCLATDISATSCTENWVQGVAASGTFVKDPNITTSTWGSGSNGIPSGWTVEDATA